MCRIASSSIRKKGKKTVNFIGFYRIIQAFVQKLTFHEMASVERRWAIKQAMLRSLLYSNRCIVL